MNLSKLLNIGTDKKTEDILKETILNFLKKNKKHKFTEEDADEFLNEVLVSREILDLIIKKTNREKELLEFNQSFLDLIFDIIQVGIIVINQDGQIILSNQQVAKMLNYEYDELEDKDFTILIPVYLREKISGLLKKSLKIPIGIDIHKQATIQKKSGAFIPVDIRVIQHRIKRKNYFICSIKDRNKEDEYLKKITDLAAFPDQNPNPVARFSVSGKELYSNEPFEKTFKNNKELSFADIHIEEIHQALYQNKIHEKDYSIQDFIYHFKFVPIVEHAYVNVYAKDVTQEREIDRLRNEFVSNVSHELKTPLTSILGFSYTLKETKNIDEDSKNNFLSIIIEESQRLAELINDVLDLTRYEMKKINFDFIPNDLEVLTKSVVESTQPVVDEKLINLNLKIDSTNNMVYCDEKSIRRVLINLISNAVKFSNEGSDIEVALTDQEDHLQISIKDNGMGIPIKDQQHIFDKFYRVQRPGHEIQGTGLGLAITKEIMEAHGSRISFESKPGEGTCFHLFFKKIAN